MATYYSISRTLSDNTTETIKDRIWSYNEPTRASSQLLDTCLSMLVHGTAMLTGNWSHHSQVTFMADG